MMVKMAVLLLLILVGLAIFGGFSLRMKRPQGAKCRSCGRPKIGKGPCPCGEGKRG